MRADDRAKSCIDLGSARTVIKCPAFHFNGRIRYEKKGEKLEERLLVSECPK